MFRPRPQLLGITSFGGAPDRGLRLIALLAGLWAMGCQPKIGDECETAIDCSTLGDRLCDTSQPNGYCTVFNCEPDTCEDEAVCVAFDTELDPACQGVDGRYGRFGRTFCMRKCNEDDDCRDDGYICVEPRTIASTVVDTETDADQPQRQKFCIAGDATSPALNEPSTGPPPAACYPNEPTDLPPPYNGSGGAGGAGVGGAGGMGGAGTGGAGMGGAGGMGTGGMGGASGMGGAMGGASGMGGSGGA